MTILGEKPTGAIPNIPKTSIIIANCYAAPWKSMASRLLPQNGGTILIVELGIHFLICNGLANRFLFVNILQIKALNYPLGIFFAK